MKMPNDFFGYIRLIRIVRALVVLIIFSLALLKLVDSYFWNYFGYFSVPIFLSIISIILLIIRARQKKVTTKKEKSAFIDQGIRLDEVTSVKRLSDKFVIEHSNQEDNIIAVYILTVDNEELPFRVMTKNQQADIENLLNEVGFKVTQQPTRSKFSEIWSR